MGAKIASIEDGKGKRDDGRSLHRVGRKTNAACNPNGW